MKLLFTLAVLAGTSVLAQTKTSDAGAGAPGATSSAQTMTMLPDGGLATGSAGPTGAAAPAVQPKTFSRETVQEIMVAHQADIQQCYDTTLSERYGKTAEHMGGKLVATFVVTKTGKVINAGAKLGESTVKDKQLRDCVVGVIRQLEFPAPKDGKRHPIEYPYQLKVIK
jgi:hypothetical protein